MAEAEIPSVSVANRRRWDFVQRHGLLLVGVSPVLANLIGSAFNIWYNYEQIHPELSPLQLERFQNCLLVFNLIVYPLAVASWAAPLVWLRSTHRALLAGEDVPRERLVQAQRCVVNLPWWILSVALACWLLCTFVFPLSLKSLPEPLSQTVVWHLIISFLIGGSIAITHSFFAVELVSQRALFPVYFRRESPADVPGARPMTLRTRGLMWAISAVVSPVLSLLLLILSPQAAHETPYFAIVVSAIAAAFGLFTAWMLSKLVEKPVRELKNAAMRVSDGDLTAQVTLMRADDFGPLIARFNEMVAGLSERERLQQTFGRHVGQAAAKQILAQGEGLGGVEQTISVMFVDVRNFTAHSSKHSPEEVVAALNVFFTVAVETIEAHGGMVNKFLGDGFMALFGIGAELGIRPSCERPACAQQALNAGKALLQCVSDAGTKLAEAGWPGLQIGVGINTGPAVVGSIGSPERQEYTAIGDTVNVAARVEALTKQVGRPLLVTEATRSALPPELPLELLPPQQVKGKGEALRVYAFVRDAC